MKENRRTKKTFYIDSGLVKKVKIKSAVDEESETETVNFILEQYFKTEGKKYQLQK